MREQCIPHLVESWFQILQTYQQSHPELTCQCLEVVGAYVSWIDLNLIANDRSVHAMMSLLDRPTSFLFDSEAVELQNDVSESGSVRTSCCSVGSYHGSGL